MASEPKVLDYFCCFNSYARKTAKLSDQEVGRLFRALMKYNETGERQELTGRESIAFDFIADDIDRAKEKYLSKCEQNRANASGGGDLPANASGRNRTPANASGRNQDKDKDDDKDKTKNKDDKSSLSSSPTTTETTGGGGVLSSSAAVPDETSGASSASPELSASAVFAISPGVWPSSASAVTVPGESEVMTRFQEFLPGASADVRRRLREYCQRLGAEVCLLAIRETIDAAPVVKNKQSYLFGILRNREADGIRSGEAWQEHERERSRRARAASGPAAPSDPGLRVGAGGRRKSNVELAAELERELMA